MGKKDNGEKIAIGREDLTSFSWVQTQILNAAAQPTNPQIYFLVLV